MRGPYKLGLDELRKRPCMKGHSREDALVRMGYNGPELRCRACKQLERRRHYARRKALAGERK